MKIKYINEEVSYYYSYSILLLLVIKQYVYRYCNGRYIISLNKQRGKLKAKIYLKIVLTVIIIMTM